MKNKFLFVISIMLVLGLVLAACKPAETTTPEVEEPETVVEEPTEEVVEEPVTTRMGGWLDEIVFTMIADPEPAVAQLQAGAIDMYPVLMSDDALFATVKADPDLKYVTNTGGYNNFLLNTVVCNDTTTLNPFNNVKIREAMNWAVDRDYIVNEILKGLGVARYTLLSTASSDYARYADVVGGLVAKYKYNLAKAQEVVDEQMPLMGAEKGADGKWQYQGKPVTIIGLIRTEDERLEIGNYFAGQLEQLGFTVVRDEKARRDAGPIWSGDPLPCLWHYYTAGWISNAISRDEGSNFAWFGTGIDQDYGPNPYYTPSERYLELAIILRNNDFDSMDERDAYFREILPLDMEEGWVTMLNDNVSYHAMGKNVSVASDLAAGIPGARLWALTARFEEQEGGTMRIAQSGILVQPWNPLAGSNWIDDAMPQRAIEDFGVIWDPYTGLARPQRVERAECTAQTGLPIGKTLDWVDLKFADTIEVPADAWYDWDAVNQVFIPAGEGQTAKVKCTVYYPADLFTKMTWHDGSNLSVGDFIFGMIVGYDVAKPESPVYDENQVGGLEAFLAHFKGVVIESVDPLTITTYDDLYGLDIENSVNTWYNPYAYGTGAWHNLVPAWLGEAAGEIAFGQNKSVAAEIEWTNMVAGPSLEIQKTYLDQAQAENLIPYAPTLGAYITPEEATARYANLQAFYAQYGHFYLGMGPYFLAQVNPVELSMVLKHYDPFPDSAAKWMGFGEPMIAAAVVEGPASVKIGEEVAFDVFITYKDMPYPLEDLSTVSWVLFNATGEVAGSGPATAIEDGYYVVTLPADLTGTLVEGANRLSVAVGSAVVAVPTFTETQFVTTK